MRDKTIDLNAQAGGGVRAICDAIEGLKAWKREYKERTEMDLDISGDLKAIRSNLNDLMQITGEAEDERIWEEECGGRCAILHAERCLRYEDGECKFPETKKTKEVLFKLEGSERQ